MIKFPKVILDARKRYMADRNVVFTRREAREIMKAALKLLPSKELDPRFYRTQASTGLPIYWVVNPVRQDIRYCPNGLFGAVIGASYREVQDAYYINTTKSAKQYLRYLETIAFGVTDTCVRCINPGPALTDYRKKVYQAVLKAA